ncbi:hypothetical protein SSBR45G_41040 [Bradyrhizobium sp. SSBR45G]|uniref:DUF5680 domain-containing protein n=1 Tax=unclassified Bradyrhizobium TaxID=2631580 RepID=UPI002342B4F9|nr:MULTISPECIES: DUF5680 domain-containing protein [unclassified Bradyrhizobium]GLH79195.1 hypothetical protein SSBR45G_41040 [Bradyrhizobium sp. SSBR45G]GLH84630.1 hypothetical protein SSBR45R_20900 [Bradyrhizobium sp. SSBR45R]
MTIDLDELAAFLVEAKKRTYAGLDDDASVASPLLEGSKQLDYQAGRFAYRDIYFGMGYFVGQETVSRETRVIWSMSYHGGIRPDLSDRGLIVAVYAFLRKALLRVDVDRPYRGPASFAVDDLSYRNESEGDLARFVGAETVFQSGRVVYDLRYGGGLLK